MSKLIHKGFKINAGETVPYYYFYPECGFVIGRNNEKIFGSYKNKKQLEKYRRLYSKKDIVLLTHKWEKVTCKDCLKQHPESEENIYKRKQQKKLKRKIKVLEKIIKAYEGKRDILDRKLYKIQKQ